MNENKYWMQINFQETGALVKLSFEPGTQRVTPGA